MGNFLDTNVTGVPFAIIDNTPIIGYEKGNTDETYRYHIKLAAKDDFVDKVGVELGVVDKLELKKTTTTINKKSKNINISLPVIGKVNIKKMSLGLASIVLGLVDGFNPCAMWILLFLISTLIGMKDKKRLWILGITFLLTSSLLDPLYNKISLYPSSSNDLYKKSCVLRDSVNINTFSFAPISFKCENE